MKFQIEKCTFVLLGLFLSFQLSAQLIKTKTPKRMKSNKNDTDGVLEISSR